MVHIRDVKYLVKLFVYTKAIIRFNAGQDMHYDIRHIFILLSLYKGNNGLGFNKAQLFRYLKYYNHTCNHKFISSFLEVCLVNGLVVKNKRTWCISSLGKYKIKELERSIRSVRMRS